MKMPYLGTFKPEFEKPLSYLKSALSNLSKSKVLCLREKVKFGTKIVLFLDWNLSFMLNEKTKFATKVGILGHFWTGI